MVEEFSEVREPGVLLVGQRFRWLIKEASPGRGSHVAERRRVVSRQPNSRGISWTPWGGGRTPLTFCISRSPPSFGKLERWQLLY